MTAPSPPRVVPGPPLPPGREWAAARAEQRKRSALARAVAAINTAHKEEA